MSHKNHLRYSLTSLFLIFVISISLCTLSQAGFCVRNCCNAKSSIYRVSKSTNTLYQNNMDKEHTITPASEKDCSITHFCFLIHGWLGNPKELGYFEHSLKNQIKQLQNNSLLNSGNGSKIITHSITCNDGKTSDGVQLGGERVAEEVRKVIAQFQSDNKLEKSSIITISFIGNSLGGLYARYAVKGLINLVQSDHEAPKIYFNVFCSTATPHLGVSQHTYIRIPRVAEKLIGKAMSITGKDLFRDNNLLMDMVSESYLKPMRLFQKRIAYANAFGTDFQVPTGTAAFLCEKSDYPHEIEKDIEGDEDNQNGFYSHNGVLFAKFQTKPDLAQNSISHNDDLNYMSVKLDNLGWTKVFVDTRYLLRLGSYKTPFGTDGKKRFIEKFQEGTLSAFTSKEVSDIFCTMNKIHIPLGHTVLVANSKSSFISFLNQNGQPVVDYLAKALIRDILQFKQLV